MAHEGGDDPALDRMLAAGDTGRILLRGGAILTMDPEVGDLPSGDVLIEGSRILDVGSDLGAAATDDRTVVVDLDGAIVLPGLHDTHRHAWQGALRHLLPDADVGEYGRIVHSLLAPLYRPEDMYAGTLISALGQIESGVTCMLDFSHNSRTAAHSDAAIDALVDSGMRAIHASSGPLAGEWDRQWPADVRRLAEERFASDDQLVTLRLGVLSGAARQTLSMDADPAGMLGAESLALARELGIRVSVDGVGGPVAAAQLEQLGDVGLLGGDTTYIHCRDLTEGAWRAIAASGGTVSLAPASAPQFGRAGSISPVQTALDIGLKPSLSSDVETSPASDMFTLMRLLLNLQRTAADMGPAADGSAPAPIPVRAVLEYATVEGARANGLLDRCGTLTPGKQADIVLIRPDLIANLPLNNAVGTVVLGTDTRSVDGVLIAGRPRKWRGALVGVDTDRIRRLVTESRDHLIAAAGYDLDVMR